MCADDRFRRLRCFHKTRAGHAKRWPAPRSSEDSTITLPPGVNPFKIRNVSEFVGQWGGTFMRYLALALIAVSMMSCNRDPNYLKQKYLQSGVKYYDGGRFKEASIMFLKSIESDRKFGPAYYHLALTDLKEGQVPNAVPALRRELPRAAQARNGRRERCRPEAFGDHDHRRAGPGKQ